MVVLQNLREKLNISDDEYSEMIDIIDNIKLSLNAKGIFLDEQVRIGFYSHMVSFIRRLKINEVVIGADDEDVISQINRVNMDLAKDLLEPLFDKYSVNSSISEVVLVAIYLQTSS